MKSILRALSRNWWVKVLSQKLLGMIPFGIGQRLNQWCVNAIQGRVAARPNAGEYRILRTVRNIELLRTHGGCTLKGMRVLELGTGWRGADSVLFHLCGAEQVTTLDHQVWLTIDSLRNSVELIERMYPQIAAELTQHHPEARQRLEQLRENCHRWDDLQQILRSAAIDYRTAPSADPRRVEIEPHSIDLFYSESVLQRIPAADLEQIVRHVSGRLLKPHSYILHRTDQRDIHSLKHAGNGAWGLGYLKYSDFVFNTFINGKFSMQNRLRESDFVHLFEENGISLSYVESRMVAGDDEVLKQFRVDRKFQQKDPIDIVTRASILVGGRHLRCPAGPVRELIRGTSDEVES